MNTKLRADDSDRLAHQRIDQVPYQTHLGPDVGRESRKLAATSKADIPDAARVFAGLSHTCDTVCSQDKYTQCKNNLPWHRDVIMISVIIENWIGAPLSSFLSLSWEDVNGSFHRISSSLYFFLLLQPLKEIAFGPAPHLNIHGNQSSHVCRVEGGWVCWNERKKKKKGTHPNNSELWMRLLTGSCWASVNANQL